MRKTEPIRPRPRCRVMLLDFVEAYVKLGLKPIAIRKSSKKPFQRGWNKAWSKVATIEIVKKYPDCSLGILLGDVIDLEADTPESNDLLDDLLKDYPHPIYRSSKSRHHLFLNPHQWLTRVVIKGIEFRGKRHHSVVPPSIHKSGIVYTWLRDSTFPIPMLPLPLSEMLISQIPKRKRHSKTSRFVRPWCDCCKKQFTVRSDEFEIELAFFRERNASWFCKRCRNVKIDVGRKAKIDFKRGKS